MRIARHIANLLYDYECVVIPGFGGFITKTHDAEIHPIKHQFKPPYKEVVFNPHLRTNDGLLLNHIAQHENLTYKEAKRRLDRFILKCLKELNKGRKITFRRIGDLYADSNQQIVFEPDSNQNYLASSFGLTSFVSPAIKRESFQEKLEKTFQEQRQARPKAPTTKSSWSKPLKKKQPETRSGPQQPAGASGRPMVASRRRKPFKKQLAFVSILLLMLGLAWAVMNQQLVSEYYKAYSGFVPFFYASPNEYLAKNMESLPVDRLVRSEQAETGKRQDGLGLPSTSNDLFTRPEADEIAKEAEMDVPGAVPSPQTETRSEMLADNDFASESSKLEETAETAPEPAVQPQSPAAVEDAPRQATAYVPGFHIIAGAFREHENANRLVNQLRIKGYNAGLAGSTGSGLLRVSYEAHNTRSLAEARLAHIKIEENPNAWILNLN